MKIIDTHCHINDDKLLPIAKEVVSRALANGVVSCFNNGDSFASFDKIIGLSKTFKGFCYNVLGIHPEFANESNDYFFSSYHYIEEHQKEIKAIGEIGLDYHFSKNPLYVSNQKKRFIEQIRLAKKLHLPIVIHSRDADFDTLNIVKKELPPKIDLHCFSGSNEILKAYLKLPIEVHIGVGGVITFKNSRVLKEVVSKNDIKIFLTETDSPYLAPTPHRGEPNEPSYLPLIIKAIANIKNLPLEDCAATLYNNGAKFYGI